MRYANFQLKNNKCASLLKSQVHLCFSSFAGKEIQELEKQVIVKTGPSLQSINRKDNRAEKKNLCDGPGWLSNEEQGKHTVHLHAGSSCVEWQLAVWIRSKVECKFQNMLQDGRYLTEDKETSGNICQQV